jgi:zinc protease
MNIKSDFLLEYYLFSNIESLKSLINYSFIMKKILPLILLFIAFIWSPFTAGAQEADTMNQDAEIPVDPDVKKGTFDNGLTYYIRNNDKPEDEVQLRLLVKAGSIQENEDQRGLAHVLEHMNFNGTENFKKNELVDYLQSIGVEFGADLNASTGFGRTLYILPIPTDDSKTLDKGFQVLDDWAHGTLLNPQMVDDERGVVLEEYRIGLGAGERMRKEYLPIILDGSRYANRLPIGTKESIQNFKQEDLEAFYKDWYRPGLMAVIAVGDLEVDAMYEKIKEHFADIKPLENAPERKEYSIPNHEETYVAVASDKEATSAQVQLTYQDEGKRQITETMGDYRDELVERLFTQMINNRLDELRNSPEPPFVFGFSSHGRYFSPNKEAYRSFAVTGEDGRLEGLKALLVTNKRIQEHGFTPSELERAKKELLSSQKDQYDGRKTRQSRSYVGSYVSNYLYRSPIAGISWEYNQSQEIVPGINLEEVSSLIDEFLHDDNRTVLITGPPMDKPKAAMEQDVRNMLAEVASMKVEPYEEEAVRENLMKTRPQKGSIANESTNDQLATTTFKLSNGAEVTYKKTDFKDNQILFRSFSYGGTSLYSTDVYKQTALANGGLTEAGVAGLSKTNLQKVLAGKNASVSPYISNLTEGMRGNATPDDLETLFQLINQYFTALNKDEEAFQSFISRQKAQFANLLSNPQFYFALEFAEFVNKNNPRFVGFPTPEELDDANYDLAYKKYQERFKNTGDFKFYFVGDIPVSEFKNYVETYIASLPATSEKENYEVPSYRPLSGDYEKIVRKGQAPQSFVNIVYNGETDYSPEKAYYMESLGEILSIKLIENLREKESGVYTVRANANMSKIPYGSYSFNISFPCGPENVDRLIKIALAEVQKIIENGPTTADLEKVKENQLQNYKQNIKQNSYWLSELYSADLTQADKTGFLDYKSKVNALTKDDIQQVAEEYLTKGHITGILYPEEEKEETSGEK